MKGKGSMETNLRLSRNWNLISYLLLCKQSIFAFSYLAARIITKSEKILEYLHKTLSLKERFYYEYSGVSMSQRVSQEGHIIGGG